MIRIETEDGWWLITHPDHAQLAADFASHWGNAIFSAPQPRAHVLHGIRAHDDGWKARDAQPSITRQGKPSAFSQELVGKYSAFEEIDLADYLAVRERALGLIEAECAYAALLICMHTTDLLSMRADRSTIAPGQLPLLDAFIERQRAKQQELRSRIRQDARFSGDEVQETAIVDNFRLLQAADNLSLYSCVGYMKEGDLLHALPTLDGGAARVKVLPVGPRQFRLAPYPLDEPLLTFNVPARRVAGKDFSSSEEFQEAVAAAAYDALTVTISA